MLTDQPLLAAAEGTEPTSCNAPKFDPLAAVPRKYKSFRHHRASPWETLKPVLPDSGILLRLPNPNIIDLQGSANAAPQNDYEALRIRDAI